jgi:pyridoxine 4-dehydrogenase
VACVRVLGGRKKSSTCLSARARGPPKTPIEETVRGRWRSWWRKGQDWRRGLERGCAAKVHAVAAVEVELSIWATERPAQRRREHVRVELGIPIVAYSPLCRGRVDGATRPKRNADVPEQAGGRSPSFRTACCRPTCG